MSRAMSGRGRSKRPKKKTVGKGKAQTPTDGRVARRRVRWTGLLLFVLALALRLLFWQATPDADWPHSVHFKGDAATWADYAASLRAGADFEFGLPLRPPGAAYLLSALWDGPSGDGPSGDGRSSLATAQFGWCLLGALTVLLVWDAARRSFGNERLGNEGLGSTVGLLVGLLCAVSHGLMVLSTSLNNETPYLFLVACMLWLWARLGPMATATPSSAWLATWGAVNGLACLVRVEHLLFFVLTTAWLVLKPKKVGAATRLALPIAAAFAVVQLPWHLKAWDGIERFNTELPDAGGPAAQAQARLEQMLGEVQWTPEAAAERDAMPAFARRAAANFVAATKLYRLGPSAAPTSSAPLVIEPADLDALHHAFGSRPEALPGHPFVTFYGGLNFYLAHNPWAEPGFSRALLDQPPPLDESRGRFPPILVDGLPPPTLAFTYPPHLHAINHGYELGLRHLASEPGATARRLVERAKYFWDGASLGFGGAGFPAMGDLLRRRADLAAPTSGGFRVWQFAWLGLVVAGLWIYLKVGLPSRTECLTARIWQLAPWLALLLTKLVASLAFFGYARHGAGAYPAFALLAALGVVGLAGRFGFDPTTAASRRKLLVGGVTLGLLVLAYEVWRFADPPAIQVDGRGIESGDPWPIDVHEDRRLSH